MTTAIDHTTPPVQTHNRDQGAKGRETLDSGSFAHHFRPVAPQDIPPTLLRNLQSIRTESDNATQRARHEAMMEAMRETGPLHEKIGQALAQLRQAFADAGMPIIDMPEISKSPDGTFHVKGWGKGESVSHPQAKFIEAVLNGKAPGFEKLSENVANALEKAEELFAKVQDIEENNAPLLDEFMGRTFVRKDSIFDDHFVMGTEHTSQIREEARKLSWRDPEGFQAFKDSLGDELDKLTSEQVLSRYHFDTVMLPGLQKALPDYFA